MAGVLTANLVYQKAKTDEIDRIRKLNVCGSSLSDIDVLRQFKNIEVLSLSVNDIAEIGAIGDLPNLTELFLRRNKIRDLNEIRHLSRLRNLQVANLSDNPVASQPGYRRFVIGAIPSLRVLDDVPVSASERQSSAQGQPNVGEGGGTPIGMQKPRGYSGFRGQGGAQQVPDHEDDDEDPEPQRGPPYGAMRGRTAPMSRPPFPSGSSCPPAAFVRVPHHYDPYTRPAGRPTPAQRSSGYSQRSTEAGPLEANVVEAIKLLCSKLSPASCQEIQEYLAGLESD